MKRLIAAIGFWIISMPAFAGVSCTLPFTLTNGTIADATQVMANYNALVTCLTQAAAAGANSDITSLTGLTTPLAPVFGGTPVFTGGTSGGSANAQTITTVPPIIKNAGIVVVFTSGFSNTGPLTVNGTNVFRQSQLGITSTVGGEVVAGQQVVLSYDGTQYQCLSCGKVIVGQAIDVTGPTAPAGYLIMDGTCVSTTTYADLFTYYGSADIWSPGSTGGACSAGNFHLPFANGSVSAAYDTQANSAPVTANKLTSGGSGCAATSVGLNCGSQNQTIAKANLPDYVLPDPGHDHSLNAGTTASYVGVGGGSGSSSIGSYTIGPGQALFTYGGLTQNNTTGVHLGGSGTPTTTIPPLFTVIKAVKY